MELKTWARTIMIVKRHLNKVINAIDHVIYKKALSSAYVNTKNIIEQSSEAVSNFIINLSQTKINLINLNLICVNALKEIDRISAKILILKHIDGRTSSEISKIFGISDRTYFRRLQKAYVDLEQWLISNNFTENYFFNKFNSEGWIMEAYFSSAEFFSGTNKEMGNIFCQNETNYIKGVIKSLTKSAYSSYS